MTSGLTFDTKFIEGPATDWLADVVRVNVNRTALIDLGSARRFTYGAFYARVCRLAFSWRMKYQLQPGDRVMVLARNSTDVYEMMCAAWRIGAVFMPINWRLAPPELATIIADATPSLIVADDDFRAGLSTDITIQQHRAGDPASDYERDIAQADKEQDFIPATLDTMNTLLFTSGTTGHPKGVMGTWRMTATMLRQTEAHHRLGPGCVTLTAAPQFHTAGLNAFAVPSLYFGGAVAVMSHWSAEASLRHLADPELAVTHTLGVPTQLQFMAQHPLFAELKFPALKNVAVGGAPPPRELMDVWAAKGHPLTPSYGMTEVFGVAVISATDALKKPGSVGGPQRLMQIRIVGGDAGKIVPPGAVGEIQLKGPGVTPGYWNQPEATAAAFDQGWFHTGDLGFLDGDGALFILDRKKDMFISGGENVYPAEVENVISTFPEVAQVAVISIPDEKWGEVGTAVVVLKPGAQLREDDMIARCRAQLAAFKIPKTLKIIPVMPLSAQGKILKTELRRNIGRADAGTGIESRV